MEKLTNEQREARRESAQNYTRSVNERVKAQLAQLPEELGKFTEGYGRDRGAESKLGIKLREELASGKCKKPSDFAKRELSALFGTQIPESLVPSASIPTRRAGTADRSGLRATRTVSGR